MTVESVAEFYPQTDGGKFIAAQAREQGREQGREAAFADLLRERFGADDRIPGIAQRLARESAPVRVILAAASLDDLAAPS